VPAKAVRAWVLARCTIKTMTIATAADLGLHIRVDQDQRADGGECNDLDAALKFAR
jgi:hypothetical protein